ncbi:MAG: DUF4837 family protein [bacterium]|nr:DUF4837 family protein [bacterium]
MPESVGPAQEIVVLADAADWQRFEGPLRDTFEKVMYTPQEEKVFSLRYGDINDMDLHKYKRRKNLLVISPIDAPHATATFLRSLLSPEVQEAIRNGSPAAISWKNDIWAQEQLLLTISGEDPEHVIENIRMEADRLYRAAEEARNKRIQTLIYHYGERKELTEELSQKYGWTVRVAFGYRILETAPDSSFVILTKEEPNRWLFVYWEDGIPPDRLTYDWCINKRDEITRRFFDGDRIAAGQVETSQTPFAGKLAVELQGLWENEKNWNGGPFKSYAFVDVDLDRFFWVDVGVFSPNKRKEPYVRQVDLMARTFEFTSSSPVP